MKGLYTLLVVLAAFAAGYFLPDLTGSGAAPPQAPAAPVTAPLTPTNRPAATAISTAPSPTPSEPPAAAALPSPSPTAVPPSPTATRTIPPATPTPQVSPTPTPRIHVVQSGDNLWDLSRKYGVTVDAIVAANKMAKPEALDVGQQLIIPPSQP